MIDAEKMYFGEPVAEGTPDYYLDDDGGLWKKEGSDQFYFSRTRLEWVKSAIFYILPSWDYENVLTDKDAEKIIADYKADGKWEEEKIPLRYFANDNDSVFAKDIFGNEFYVLADMSLKSAEKGTVDIMWGGITEKEAEKIQESEYQKGKWLLVAKGERWERYMGDYKAVIKLVDYPGEPKLPKKGFRAEIILDDGEGMPATVAYLESENLDELKEKAKNEIENRIGFRKQNGL